tara:strand:+ start:2018 stop:2596 length:579 start_codon:yes stop_codon:yes gene_type:complete
MPREFSDALNTYLSGNTFISVLLLELQQADGTTVRYTDNPFNLTYEGNTYSAQGEFIAVSETQLNSAVQISSVSISISALTLANVQNFAASSIINKPVSIHRGFIDPATNLLFGDSAGENAFLLFKGKVAGYQVNNKQTTADVTLQVSSQFVNFNRKNGRRTNQTNFHREHPTDDSMEFAHETLSEIKWGLK